jgi:hypothetical protein
MNDNTSGDNDRTVVNVGISSSPPPLWKPEEVLEIMGERNSKRLRWSRRQPEAEVHAALESARSELESLRVEVADRMEENRALERLRQYSEFLFDSLRRAAYTTGAASFFHSTANATQAAALATITAFREKAWMNFVVPTESEIRASIAPLVSPSTLGATGAPFYIRLSSFIVDWCMLPSRRSDVERRLKSMFDFRVRRFLSIPKKLKLRTSLFMFESISVQIMAILSLHACSLKCI